MGSYFVVFDCETTIDTTQKLNFGVFRYCHLEAVGTVVTIAEGIFYAEDLPRRDPDGFAVLKSYAATHVPDVDMTHRHREPNRSLEFLTRREFNSRWLWRVGYKHQDTIVGFNLPFDLTRIAVDVGHARGDFIGGFSLALWSTTDGRIDRYKPRVRVKAIDSKRAFIRFGTSNKERRFYAGTFVDVRTMVFALTGRSHSLASACDTFAVAHPKTVAEEHGVITEPYVDYARRDVLATAELYAATTTELARHPIDATPEYVYSPASLAKKYLTAMGVPRPLERGGIDPEVLGHAASSFYGARAECRIRREPVPVVLTDFTSMYPTVNTLMGLWQLLTSERIEVVDASEEVRTFLNEITLTRCFDPETWRHLVAVVEIEPDGDVLPVRARYAGTAWNIGVNHLYTSGGDVYWYALPDLVASVLLTGRAPRVRRAWRFVGVGTAASLMSTSLRGAVDLDPGSEDFFRVVIDERANQRDTSNGAFLKMLANSGSYGIFAELNRPSGRGEQSSETYSNTVLGPRQDAEVPGPYSFPPIASCITAAARLMLALLERCVVDQGGAWMMTDTDSMAIVAGQSATESGLLSWDAVEEIRGKFEQLNPYQNVTDILKWEYHGFGYAISAKRYALYHHDPDTGTVVIDKASEHGLGHLLNPTDPDSPDRAWITQLWQYLISRELGIPVDEPEWLDRPAISRYSVSQSSLWTSFDHINNNADYVDQVKPFNFILVAHPLAVQPNYQQKIVPVAPFEPDPSRWTQADWIDKRNPDRQFHIATWNDATDITPDTVYVQSYRDVVELYSLHPEAKFDQSDGHPCARDYRGPLIRKHIHAVAPIYVGKEAREIELVQRGLMSVDEVTRSATPNPWGRYHRLLAASFAHLSISEIATLLGIPRSTAGYLVAGRPLSPEHQKIAIKIACTLAAADLAESPTLGEDSLTFLTRWHDTITSQTALTITDEHP